MICKDCKAREAIDWGRCKPCLGDLNAKVAISPAIRRLIEEVRVEKDMPTRSYNRVYSRHNR